MIIDFNEIMYNLSNKSYRRIGKGSGRIVYDLDNGYVLKVAKNKKGIVQNRVENTISSNRDLDLFAKVIAISNDSKYLIMEKALKFNSKNNIKDILDVKLIHKSLEHSGLNMIDLQRTSSWGLIDNKPVIVDYGLTYEIFKKYYLKERMITLALLFVLIYNSQ